MGYLSMRSLVVILAFVGVALASEGTFLNFAKTFNKKYATTEEYNKRREIFVERYNDMLRHNQEYEEGKVSWWRKVTEHYDLTNEEIEAQLNLGMMPVEKEYMPSSVDEQMEARIQSRAAPDSWSWKDQGGVSSIKDQASCGSCAVFAAVATIDTCMWQVTGHLEDDLSEQHLMDCAYGWGYGNAGCDGGFVVSYMDWVVEGNNGYMEKESCAPYYASDMTCNDDDSCNYNQATVTGYYNNWSPDEDELKELVYINPTATAIYASYMFDYAGGIYDDSRCCEAVYDGSCDINHGVAVIGYGSEGGKDYWLIKNSWGTSWGENGFLRMKRGTGHCAVGTDRVQQPYCAAA